MDENLHVGNLNDRDAFYSVPYGCIVSIGARMYTYSRPQRGDNVLLQGKNRITLSEKTGQVLTVRKAPRFVDKLKNFFS